MTDHPITPPPELVQQWGTEFLYGPPTEPADSHAYIAARAAQWGADQELEACCEWLAIHFAGVEKILRTARRPKPPSLKEQALALLDPSNTYGSITQEEEYRISVTNAEIIRRALEDSND
jgi:hypothetical protein